MSRVRYHANTAITREHCAFVSERAETLHRTMLSPPSKGPIEFVDRAFYKLTAPKLFHPRLAGVCQRHTILGIPVLIWRSNLYIVPPNALELLKAIRPILNFASPSQVIIEISINLLLPETGG